MTLSTNQMGTPTIIGMVTTIMMTVANIITIIMTARVRIITIEACATPVVLRRGCIQVAFLRCAP
jgi:hypothetical protein